MANTSNDLPSAEKKMRLTSVLLGGAQSRRNVDDAPILKHPIARESGMDADTLLPCVPLIAAAFRAVRHQYYLPAIYNRPMRYASLSQHQHVSLELTTHAFASAVQVTRVVTPGGAEGRYNRPARMSMSSVALATTSCGAELAPLSHLGDEFQNCISMHKAVEQSGAVVNTISGAGHIDLSSLMVLAAQVRTTGGSSFEEAAPARLALMRLTWKRHQDVLAEARLADQFLDWKISNVRLPRTLPVDRSKRAVSVVLTTLDQYVAVKSGARGMGGWGRYRPVDFDHEIAVVPVHSRDLTSEAVWLYLMSFLDTRVWQGLYEVEVSGRLDWDVVEQGQASALGYRAEDLFSVYFAPYSDSVVVPGARALLVVIMDQTSKACSGTLTLGPYGNSIDVPVWRDDEVVRPVDATPLLLTSLTGDDWREAGHELVPPHDDVYVEAQTLLEEHVATSDVIDVAYGVVTALAFRVKAPMLLANKDLMPTRNTYETKRYSWFLDPKYYQHQYTGVSSLKWIVPSLGEQQLPELASDLANYECQWWMPSGICGYHTMVDVSIRRYRDDPFSYQAPILGRLGQACGIARLWRSAGMSLGPDTPVSLRSAVSYSMFFKANAGMMACAVSLAQCVLGVPLLSWAGYYDHDSRWTQWMSMFMDVASLKTLIWPGRVSASSKEVMVNVAFGQYRWDTGARSLNREEVELVSVSTPYALMPPYLIKWWFEKIEGVWDDVETPESDQYVVESAGRKTPQYGRMWKNRRDWASLLEYSSEIPLDNARTTPFWYRGVTYATSPHSVYPNPSVVGFNTIAYSNSQLRHELTGTGDCIQEVRFQSGSHSKFEQLEGACLLIPHVFQTTVRTNQSVLTLYVNKTRANKFWTAQFVSDMPDPWVNWLTGMASAALPFLHLGNPILGLGRFADNDGAWVPGGRRRGHQSGPTPQNDGRAVVRATNEAVDVSYDSCAAAQTSHSDGQDI